MVQCWLRAELPELSSHQCTVLMCGQLSKGIRKVNKPAEMEWNENLKIQLPMKYQLFTPKNNATS